jgi:hypothetical protein
MAETSALDLASLLEALAAAEVEFIIVGGVACLLHGAPTTTLDLDVVHRVSAENLTRLEDVLATLDAEVRDPAGRRIVPNRSHLEAGGQLQLTTRLGPLDLLTSLHDGRTFDDLIASSVSMKEGDWTLEVIDLPTLIAIKRSTGRVRDRLMVPLLLALAQLDDD